MRPARVDPGAVVDLRVPPGPGVPAGLVIPAGDLVERFSRSSGPGGQGVNTADSRVEVSVDLSSCAGLTETQRRRLLARLGPVLTVTASEHRQQLRNRTAARERLAAMIRAALAPDPPKRRATRPTRGSQQRRLDAKRRRAETKAARRRPLGD